MATNNQKLTLTAVDLAATSAGDEPRLSLTQYAPAADGTTLGSSLRLNTSGTNSGIARGGYWDIRAEPESTWGNPKLTFTKLYDGTVSNDLMSLFSNGSINVSGGAVFNQDSTSQDFRIESDTNTHMLFVDAGNNGGAVVVGSSTPRGNGTEAASLTSVSSQGTGNIDAPFFAGHSSTGIGDGILMSSIDRSAYITAANFKSYGTQDTTRLRFRLQLDSTLGNNLEVLSLDKTETIVNEFSADRDFRVESDGDSHMLFVDAATNAVGIKTDTPLAPLHVNGGIVAGGSATNGGIMLAQKYGSGILGSVDGDYTSTIGGFYSTGAMVLGWGMRGPIGITEYNDSAGAYRSTFDNFTSYRYAAEISGSGFKVKGSTGNVQTTVNEGIGTKEILGISATAAVINGSGTDVDFRVASDGNSNMLFVNAGADSVSIGTATDLGAGVLQVQDRVGRWAFTTKTTDQGGLYYHWNLKNEGTNAGAVIGQGVSVSYQTTSDARLKENVKTITDGTETVMAMRPVTHTWVNNPEMGRVTGFIAQEIKPLIPEAVSGEPDGEAMMMMDYGRITPVIVAALQDAHRKIKELESRLLAMENK